MESISGKKQSNLQIWLEGEDFQNLDRLREQFDAFPPRRGELARPLIRFAIAKVIQNKPLLKVICQVFEKAIIADVGAVEAMVTDPDTERRRQEYARRNGLTLEQADRELYEIGCWQAEEWGYGNALRRDRERVSGAA